MKTYWGLFQVVHGGKLRGPNAGGASLIYGWGTKIHMPRGTAQNQKQKRRGRQHSTVAQRAQKPLPAVQSDAQQLTARARHSHLESTVLLKGLGAGSRFQP